MDPRLLVIQYRSTVGFFQIIGSSELLDLAVAVADGFADNPGTRAIVAPIAKRKTGSNRDEVRLLLNRQLSRLVLSNAAIWFLSVSSRYPDREPNSGCAVLVSDAQV
jgi:hypothetical protein